MYVSVIDRSPLTASYTKYVLNCGLNWENRGTQEVRKLMNSMKEFEVGTV